MPWESHNLPTKFDVNSPRFLQKKMCENCLTNWRPGNSSNSLEHHWKLVMPGESSNECTHQVTTLSCDGWIKGLTRSFLCPTSTLLLWNKNMKYICWITNFHYKDCWQPGLSHKVCATYQESIITLITIVYIKRYLGLHFKIPISGAI